MSQRFCAWILLANRKIILSDGRLRVLFLAGARQAAVRLQGELWVLLRVPLLWHVCSPCAWESHLLLQPFTLYPCPLFLYFRYAVSPKLQKHIERSRPDHQCSSGHPCLLLNILLVGWVIPLPLTLWTGNYRVLLFFFFFSLLLPNKLTVSPAETLCLSLTHLSPLAWKNKKNLSKVHATWTLSSLACVPYHHKNHSSSA